MANYHDNDMEAFQGINPHPLSVPPGSEAVTIQAASANQAHLPLQHEPNYHMPNNANVIGDQPGGVNNHVQGVIVQPHQDDDDMHPEIHPLTEEVRAALITIANSNPPIQARELDPELLQAIIAGIARMVHARNGRCRHVDEVTGEHCPARRWRAGARKCLSHLKNRPSLDKQLLILLRRMQGQGTCSGDYAWKERDNGTLCDNCARKHALRRGRAER